MPPSIPGLRHPSAVPACRWAGCGTSKYPGHSHRQYVPAARGCAGRVNVSQRHLISDLLQQPEPLPDKPGGDLFSVLLPCQRPAAGLADAPAQRIVAEADCHLRPVTVTRLADDFRQAVLTVVAVVPAGLTVVFLHRAAVNVIAPADAVELRHAVVGYLFPNTILRVTCHVLPPCSRSGSVPS